MIITPEHLSKNLHDYYLIDVRQPDEFAFCQIQGSVNIPLGQLLNNLDDIPHDRPIVTICHHGVRSMNAAIMLKNAGIKNVLSLSGGVEQWATLVDPTMKRY